MVHLDLESHNVLPALCSHPAVICICIITRVCMQNDIDTAVDVHTCTSKIRNASSQSDLCMRKILH